jgi:hypothetical protein
VRAQVEQLQAAWADLDGAGGAASRGTHSGTRAHRLRTLPRPRPRPYAGATAAWLSRAHVLAVTLDALQARVRRRGALAKQVIAKVDDFACTLRLSAGSAGGRALNPSQRAKAQKELFGQGDLPLVREAKRRSPAKPPTPQDILYGQARVFDLVHGSQSPLAVHRALNDMLEEAREELLRIYKHYSSLSLETPGGSGRELRGSATRLGLAELGTWASFTSV